MRWKLKVLVEYEYFLVIFVPGKKNELYQTDIGMKTLTKKEMEIMELFWEHGAMFVKELQELYPDPKPHVNTLSTMVRILESNSFLGHKAYGNTYQYYPAVSRTDYGKSRLSGIITSCFDDSYMSAVSSFVREEKISVEELKALVEQIEKGRL